MRNQTLLYVRIYGERHGDHWAFVSFDFGLAAQRKTLREALGRLDGQVRDYLSDSISGEDKAYGQRLLSRKLRLFFS